ncbi:glycosyltransferase family A protein [Agriterribacter sp.]|uniref:glycosyltransferase family 2 protein n=1 Tax=Agriterribacter sp. TaxID=2821509 RepID=UPI002B77D95C|nr:glycosyltransferase family A protein [Agriterribacter sp.]HRO45288.1 glycosyltransferase family A protein [Agriterribacter sp.]HRQ19411.1 glycosyltransferase family A protein [Agriterribacter sp.]
MEHAENTGALFHLPFFSVIITSYNRVYLLKRALGSLIIQTEKDWEAIIVDDGSTDGTHAQITPYLELNNKITYIRQLSKGCVASKNSGILLSTGKYITFLDSDDEFSPDHLATRKAIIMENPDVDFLHGGVKVIGSPYVPDRYDYEKMVHLHNCAIGGTFFIERNLAFLMKGFSDMCLGHDADFLDRVIQCGATVIKTELPTYIYHRETQNSITNNLTGKKAIL